MAFLFVLGFSTASPAYYFSNIRRNPLQLGLLLFFLWQMVSTLFSENQAAGWKELVQRLPLLLFPLAFSFISLSENNRQRLLLFYSFAAVVGSFIGFMYGLYLAIQLNDYGYIYNDNISSFINGKQAVYFGLYINIAVIFMLRQLQQGISVLEPFKKWMYVGIIWLLFVNFMLASKMAMISLGLILVGMMGSYLIKHKKYMEGLLLIVGILVAVVLLGKFFPKTLNRFNGLTETNYQFDNDQMENHFNAAFDAQKWHSTNVRMAVWRCGFEIWKAKPLLGTGLGDRKQVIKEKYEEKKFWFALKTEKNLHNQYLDVLVSMGPIGLLLFVGAFVLYPLFYFRRYRLSEGIYCILCIAFCLLTENMLDRYQGLILIGFIIPFMAMRRNEEALPQEESLAK